MKYIKFSIVKKEKRKKVTFNPILSFILKFIPKANPDFEDKIDEVNTWLIEFENEDDFPTREIGIDINDTVILKMPYNKNYGYWTDNDLNYNDFSKIFKTEIINQDLFYKKWEEVG